MGSTRRTYTPEYKAHSVAFVLDGDRSVADVARNIGVHEMTLGKWVKKVRDRGIREVPGCAAGRVRAGRAGQAAGRVQE